MTSSVEKCVNYHGCSAPLCPLDESTWETVAWYVDDPICNIQELQGLDWIRKQRKLVKAKKKGFFTVSMLDVMERVTSDGIDPDSKQTIVGWINKRRNGSLGEVSPGT